MYIFHNMPTNYKERHINSSNNIKTQSLIFKAHGIISLEYKKFCVYEPQKFFHFSFLYCEEEY